MTDHAAPPHSGLSQNEAEARLAQDGPNALPSSERRSLIAIVIGVLTEPMFALLLGAGVIYLVLGDLTEALALLGFATLSTSIAVVQETRSERVLEALRDLTSPRALVIRDGVKTRIAGRDVVHGDLMVLDEGDRVPADARLIRAHDVLVDESLLTGEAAAVRKRAGDADDAVTDIRPGGDDLPFVYSGSLVVRGQGVAEVTATGPRSEIGRIGVSLGKLETEPPKLRAETTRIVRIFAGIALVVCALAVVLYGIQRGDWLEASLAAIAVGMSLLPEEFPLVLTVFMVMGAWRISRARVLTRKASAIEALGAATVLCTDKTGTLTENRMRVVAVRTPQGMWQTGEDVVPDSVAGLIESASLASARDAFDPMERAVHDAAGELAHGNGALGNGGTLVQRYGLRPDLLAVTHVWQPQGEDVLSVYAKGAPEAIADLSGLDDTMRDWLRTNVDAMAKDGMRVLGVARGHHDGGDLPESPHGYAFTFQGLIGFADPLRESVPGAVRECREAGVRVMMLTGDYPATAQFIARQAGIAADDVMTGAQIDGLSDDELAEHLTRANVFARIMPEQKLRIVQALKARGEVVAMTGDGVNDAPALKAAHIGIAMGGRGTDVAREASSIVLLDDDFTSIVRTLRLGRRIYDNLRKAMGYIIAVHVPIAGLALLPLAFGIPPILMPVHIAFLEMVIDPACSIVFEGEAEEDDIMRRPPRKPDSLLLSPALLRWGVMQGVFLLAAVVATFAWGMHRAMLPDELRALVFTTMVLVNFGAIFVDGSFAASMTKTLRATSRMFWVLLVAIFAALGTVLFWPPARALFHFGALQASDLAVCLAVGLAPLIVMAFAKLRWRRALVE